MVRHKDVGLLAVEQFAPFHLDRQEHYPAHKAAPHHCGIVAPRPSLAAGTADDGRDGRQSRCQQDERQSDEELVCSIKNFQNYDIIFRK